MATPILYQKNVFRLLLCAAALPLHAQGTPASSGAVYDVVSVKVDKSGPGMMRINGAPDGFSGTNVSLKLLLQYAYRVKTQDQIVGLPGWANTAGYDVEGKMDADEIAALKTMSKAEASAQTKHMMLALLEDRFHLKAHIEQRELPVYNLVIAKGGFKLKEADPDETYENGAKGPDGKSHGGMIMMRSGSLTAQGFTIANFATNLAAQLSKQVIDMTGLKGVYDITLNYMPEQGSAPLVNGQPGDLPSLFTALQEQLGLKLEPAKAMVDIVVVDHVEAPTEN